ncbi:putative mitochondrial hypothetical protein [Leptomonas pyrrhocoris]|uniref:TLC domain-containing protein n=1 Tax=Leptomonas pyrrhocoris TaxID=157538 RepID=A0A0M9FQT2_LEPPY|nr:putative mitochondrial hypothetical protein [Leptomonas pyrrhocoris]KPA74190.1 putative mitochondrial hypothetical protein [Leptomonas pyrrhocoris]|eukprot:XP_015652629.1 putative mitochondrial hypothetical protein [Leptomonas pyrrhocoris]
MGFATAHDTWVAPMLRDGIIFAPMVCFWFTCQFLFTKQLPKRVPNWKKLTTAQKEDIIVRCCSIANAGIMSLSAVLFVTNLIKSGGVLSNDLYATMPYYRFSRVAIVAYFVWDIFVCYYYRWSLSWKLHAFCSFIGSYTLLFPFSEYYAGYYTGCFELSNGFLHASIIMRDLCDIADKKTQKRLIEKLEKRATVCEYVFGGLYLLIRVIGGTYVTGNWLYSVLSNWRSDVVHAGEAGHTPRVHNEVATGLAVVALTTVQLLQYFWFGEIVKKALGLSSGASAEPTDGEKKK